MGTVSTLRLAQGRAGDLSTQVIGIDPETYPKVASLQYSQGGTDADIARLSEGRVAIINGIFASQEGTNPGDVITVDSPNGPKEYAVATVGTDYLNAKIATIYLSQDQLEQDFGVAIKIHIDHPIIMADKMIFI